jgi:SAM-dependent methyltransferase
MPKRANYGNWVPQGITLVFLIAAVILFIPALFLSIPALKGVLFAGAALCLLFFLYLMYAAYLLARDDGRLQRQFRGLVVDRLPWSGQGEALDIGTGNGALAIALAKRHAAARVIGVDLWGKPWTYSKASCDENAVLEGVGDRASFTPASAEDLPFDDGHFDAVVSNFVFHAVRTDDRLGLVREALRVLKVGGHFAFQDLFNDQFYAAPGRLVDELESWGLHDVRFVASNEVIQVPLALRPKHMTGGAGVLYGTK